MNDHYRKSVIMQITKSIRSCADALFIRRYSFRKVSIVFIIFYSKYMRNNVKMHDRSAEKWYNKVM